jgi:hypothetical protein
MTTLHRRHYSLRMLFLVVTICALASPAIRPLVAKYKELATPDAGTSDLDCPDVPRARRAGIARRIGLELKNLEWRTVRSQRFADC